MKFTFKEDEQKALFTCLALSIRKLKLNRKQRRELSKLSGKFMPNAAYVTLNKKQLRQVAMLAVFNLSTLEAALTQPELEDEDKKDAIERAHRQLSIALDRLGEGIGTN